MLNTSPLVVCRVWCFRDPWRAIKKSQPLKGMIQWCLLPLEKYVYQSKQAKNLFLLRQHSLGVFIVWPYEPHPQTLLWAGLTRHTPCPMEVCGQVGQTRWWGLWGLGRGPATVPGWPETPATSLSPSAPAPLTHRTAAAGATARARGPLLRILWRHSNLCASPHGTGGTPQQLTVPVPWNSQNSSQQPPR